MLHGKLVATYLLDMPPHHFDGHILLQNVIKPLILWVMLFLIISLLANHAETLSRDSRGDLNSELTAKLLLCHTVDDSSTTDG